jgi:hypothetical protein
MRLDEKMPQAIVSVEGIDNRAAENIENSKDNKVANGARRDTRGTLRMAA